MVPKLENGHLVEVDGIPTKYYDLGQGDPVLFIHGSSPGNDGEFAWSRILPQFVTTFRTVVVDAPGYGDSQMLKVTDTPENVGRHLVKLLDQLRVDKFAVVGHSRGGRIAVEVAAGFPLRVTRLAIVCSGSVAPAGHVSDEGKWTNTATAIVSFGADGDSSYESFARARRGSVYDPSLMPDEMLRPYYDRFIATRLDEWVRRMKEFDPLAFYHSEDHGRFQGKLRGLRLPTTIVCGREDKIGRWDRSLPLIDMIADVEFHVLPRCGHFPQLERPVALSGILLDFLTRKPEPARRDAAIPPPESGVVVVDSLAHD